MEPNRLFDLVRQQRQELFDDDLITMEEYAYLMTDPQATGAVKRLEEYDELRGRCRELDRQLVSVCLRPSGLRWVCDAAHEDGNYRRHCVDCEQVFVGHKRRLVCPNCALKSVAHVFDRVEELEKQLAADAVKNSENAEVAPLLTQIEAQFRLCEAAMIDQERRVVEAEKQRDEALAQLGEEEEAHLKTIQERDDHEERINKIGLALRLGEEGMTWSNQSDVAENCIAEIERIRIKAALLVIESEGL